MIVAFVHTSVVCSGSYTLDGVNLYNFLAGNQASKLVYFRKKYDKADTRVRESMTVYGTLHMVQIKVIEVLSF